jgi:ABC-type glycerol-3-phosphate transport system substrate-binding protein
MPWLAMQSVSVDSDNKDVAWDFNMFLVEPEHELRIVKNNGGMSRYEQFQDDPYFKTLPYYDVYVDMITNRPIVRNPYLDPNSLVAEWETKVGEVAVELLTNPDADAEELMRELAVYARGRLAEVR